MAGVGWNSELVARRYAGGSIGSVERELGGVRNEKADFVRANMLASKIDPQV